VTGYQKSKCSSKLVPQIITKITNKEYGDRQMRERERDKDEVEIKLNVNKSA